MALSPKTLPLDAATIESFQDRLEAFINEYVAEIAKTCPGVPQGAIRNTLIRGGCKCEAALSIMARKEKAA